jgi:hypothetical protein
MEMGMQHGQEHAAWTGACSIDMNMQHEHGQDMEKAWTKTTIGPAWIVVNFFPEVFIEDLAEISESKWKYVQKVAEVLSKISRI